jgi:DNA modification methylase
MSAVILRADARALPLPDASVDAIVCDPPYGLGFMGKEWDSGKSFVERRAARGNTFDHVGGNHNPVDSADAARTRRVESARFGAWCQIWAAEALRVLKPGGHLLAFGGSRTWHRLTVAIEDVGFEIRDSIAWLYGSGFPKSLDVAKAIDRQRDDADDIVRVSTFLAEHAERLGISRADVDRHMGTSDMGG